MVSTKINSMNNLEKSIFKKQCISINYRTAINNNIYNNIFNIIIFATSNIISKNVFESSQ